MAYEHDAASQIGSNEFQKRTGRLDHEKRMEEHVRHLLMDKEGKIRKEFLQNINCPLCNNNYYQELFQRWGFTYVRCNECGMMYVNPMLNDKMVNFEYESGYENDWVEMLLNPTQREFDHPKFLNGIKKIESTIGRKGKILDVGCATGHFLEICKERGWNVLGLELTKSAIDYCKKTGLDVMPVKLEDAKFNAREFDAVTLWDVLEHIPKPRTILSEVKRILKDDGVLLILVPNAGSLAARILQEKCNMFGGFAHINIFTPNTMKQIITDTGFSIVSMETIISEINIINNYLNYEHPYSGKSEGKKCILEFPELDEKFVHKNLLGYKILVMCRKSDTETKSKVNE